MENDAPEQQDRQDGSNEEASGAALNVPPSGELQNPDQDALDNEVSPAAQIVQDEPQTQTVTDDKNIDEKIEASSNKDKQEIEEEDPKIKEPTSSERNKKLLEI